MPWPSSLSAQLCSVPGIVWMSGSMDVLAAFDCDADDDGLDGAEGAVAIAAEPASSKWKIAATMQFHICADSELA